MRRMLAATLAGLAGGLGFHLWYLRRYEQNQDVIVLDALAKLAERMQAEYAEDLKRADEKVERAEKKRQSATDALVRYHRILIMLASGLVRDGRCQVCRFLVTRDYAGHAADCTVGEALDEWMVEQGQLTGNRTQANRAMVGHSRPNEIRPTLGGARHQNFETGEVACPEGAGMAYISEDREPGLAIWHCSMHGDMVLASTQPDVPIQE